MRRVGPALIAIAAMLGGCNRHGPVDPKAARASGLPTVNEPAPSANGEPHGATTPAASPLPRPSTSIPAALQGRWGLAPGDCTSTRGDAKGLLIVSAGELRFYESRAVAGPDVQAGADSISGHFDFSGEGQKWSKWEALKLQKQRLIRTEANPTASFSYAKCD